MKKEEPIPQLPTLPDDLMPSAEAAKLLGVYIGTLRRWIHLGQLPAFRIGGRIRVSRRDALAMLQRVETAPPRIATRAEVEAREAEVDRVLREAGVRR